MSTVKRFLTRRIGRSVGDKTTCCRFYHFPIRDKNECIKYIFAYLTAPYEDIQINFNDWNMSDMAKDTPFGHLPVIDVDGKKIAGTVPILRYLGRRFHLSPTASLDQADADMYADVIENLTEKLKPVTQAGFFLNDSDRKAREWKNYKSSELMPMLSALETRLDKQKFMCGDKISWVDFMVAEFIDRLESCYEQGVLKAFPGLTALHAKIHDMPSMRVYLFHRPKFSY